jgi:hypothetical protein
MVGVVWGFPWITGGLKMNEQSVRLTGDEIAVEEGCCLCCRVRRWCVRRRQRQLKDFLYDLLMFDALSDLTDDSAQRMVGG